MTEHPLDLAAGLLAALIAQYRYPFQSEAVLQESIATMLRANDVEFEREVRLGAHGRLDFLADGIAVEVKIHDPLSKVLRQLHRYAQHDQVQAIVLVTTKAHHGRMPPSLNGKPLRVASLLGGAF